MTIKRTLSAAVLLSGVAMFSFSPAAHAGFEWKGPVEPPAQAVTAPEDNGGDMSGMTPMMMPGEAPAPAGDAAPQMTSPAPVASAPVPPQVEQQAAPQAMPVAAAPAPQDNGGPVLSGFGKDVPLVMALQQIVPAGYQYSFSNGVNPGTSVTWHGGKAWQGVLSDALSSSGLGYTVQNNAVVVEVAAASSAPAGMSAPMPEPADSGMSAMPQDSGAPINIVSQPPGAATAQPADTAAGAAPAAAAATASEKDDTLTIRRKKSPSFFERLGSLFHHGSKEETAAAPSQQEDERTASMSSTPSYTMKDGHMEPSQPAQPAPMAPMASEAPAASGSSAAPASAAASAPAPAADTAADTAPDASGSAVSSVAAVHTAIDDANMGQGAQVSSPAPAAADAAMTPMPDSAPVAPVASAKADDAAPAAPVVTASSGWQAKKGDTLRDVLKSWSDKAGVELYWSIDYDYRLHDNVAYAGNYEQAVGNLLDQFSAVRPQPYGQLHQGSQGPRVLVIKSYDLTQ